MTQTNLDPYLGRALLADGLGTTLSSAVGGSPTTTYAENIGVMAATRVYSTAAYMVAAIVAILLGFIPKFGAIVSSTPGGVLGGITVVLYGMIGLLGAKIWKENQVDFANPVNLVPIAAGIIAGIGGVVMPFGPNFELSGIALGSIVAIVMYHVARPAGPPELREPLGGGAARESGTKAISTRQRGHPVRSGGVALGRGLRTHQGPATRAALTGAAGDARSEPPHCPAGADAGRVRGLSRPDPARARAGPMTEDVAAGPAGALNRLCRAARRAVHPDLGPDAAVAPRRRPICRASGSALPGPTCRRPESANCSSVATH